MAQVRVEGRRKTTVKESTCNEGDLCFSLRYMLLHLAVFFINFQKINCVVIVDNVQNLRFHRREGTDVNKFLYL
jgi:hypothetical protein